MSGFWSSMEKNPGFSDKSHAREMHGKAQSFEKSRGWTSYDLSGNQTIGSKAKPGKQDKRLAMSRMASDKRLGEITEEEVLGGGRR